MNQINDWLAAKLNRRKANGNLRNLTVSDHLVDFASNDYLSFARDDQMLNELCSRLQSSDFGGTGATGSRLISGNSAFCEKLEARIAEFHHAEAALIINSGFDANFGLLSCVPQRGDHILYDALAHASIRDGCRLSLASSSPFRHNDLEHLSEKLLSLEGRKFIVVESLYSMDGDFAPLEDLAELSEQTGAALIVDEAHATGMFAQNGEGRVYAAGIESACFARIHTYGKAMGAHGASILGSTQLKKYLINYCRPFIFSTALPIHSLYAIDIAYDKLSQVSDKILSINTLCDLFKSKMKESAFEFLPSQSQIQSVIIPGNSEAKAVEKLLRSRGFYAKAILSPTVKKGEERIRICFHAHNSAAEVEELVALLCRSPGTKLAH